eukprot:scaffold71737_cov20-Tisochrysis_lutea.AAC.4
MRCSNPYCGAETHSRAPSLQSRTPPRGACRPTWQATRAPHAPPATTSRQQLERAGGRARRRRSCPATRHPP